MDSKRRVVIRGAQGVVIGEGNRQVNYHRALPTDVGRVMQGVVIGDDNTQANHFDLLSAGVENASLSEIKQAMAHLSSEVERWRHVAQAAHDRAEKEAKRGRSAGRQQFMLGLALSVPIGLIGSLLAWLLGIS
ncbi:hypothetical protein [Phytohabitans houttuyneae]|uniref:Uncharacterized protein n=1 Tax=Phytohabitans houttuyneae TaxID=1076126 RepID=A0A6V8JV16_9ACTN|nr:hypothetical protein [Phytohabitans houttuyneae]GFJ76452.1 hypothetical protein Phou_006320 [Phytohabitans houttuyneae]